MLWDEPKIFFLERRYFFSIILSEFLKNRVALHEVYDTQHIYGKRKNSAKDPIKGLYYAGIWQELGLMESDACTEWAKSILL